MYTWPSTQYDVCPRSRHATEVVSPDVDRAALAPSCASRNAPVPNVHLADPGRQAAFGQQRGLLVDDQPGHGHRRPENVCAADDLVAADDLGQRLAGQAEQVEQLVVPLDRVQRRSAATGWPSTRR